MKTRGHLRQTASSHLKQVKRPYHGKHYFTLENEEEQHFFSVNQKIPTLSQLSQDSLLVPTTLTQSQDSVKNLIGQHDSYRILADLTTQVNN